MINSGRPLILASGSRYRRDLLARLRLPIHAEAPDLDETAAPGESARALVRRLARAKAMALQDKFPGHWLLGSDQAAAAGNRILGKPGSREAALGQLEACSGRTVEFLTAVALVADGQVHEALDCTTVHFRTLTRAEIERYIDAEPALDCAGSFKCEGLGISLFERIDSQDPTGLIGLPLTAVCRLLRAAGAALP